MNPGLFADLHWPALLFLSVLGAMSGLVARRFGLPRRMGRKATLAAQAQSAADGIVDPLPCGEPPTAQHAPAGSRADSLVPDVPAALLRISTSGRILAANPAWHALAGRPPPLAHDLELAALAHPASRDAVATLLAGLPPQGPVPPFELRMRHGEGPALDLEIRVSPCAIDGQGVVSELLLAFSDVTALRRSERALAFREARYRSLVEDQADLVSLATTDGILTFVNHAYAAHFGAPAEAMVGRSLYDFIAEADRPAVRRHLRNVFESGKVSVGQNRLVSPDGRQVWVEWMNRALPDSEGRKTVLHSVGRDITERIQAERAIQVLQHEQATILNSELIGIAKVRDRHFVWVSRGLAHIYGYEPDQMVGAPTRMVYFDDESHAKLGAAAYPILRAGGTFRTETETRHASGRSLWLEGSAVMFDAALEESLWVYTDVSARRQAELALRHALEVEAGQRMELAAFRDAAEAESELAGFLLQKLSRSGQLEHAGVAYHWQPAETFSGDLIAVAFSGTGDLYGMLADATGHGLSAAINLIPLSSAFHAMAAKGFSLVTISEQLNQVVKEYSQADRFVAVTLARFLARERRLEIANAGNPGALLIAPDGEVLREFQSGSVPFGVLDRSRFRPRVEAIALQGHEQLLLYSDGVVEALDTQGSQFGRAAMLDALRTAIEPGVRVQAVREALERHTADAPRLDDISLLLLDVPYDVAGLPEEQFPALSGQDLRLPTVPCPPPLQASGRQSAWAVALHFSAEQLRTLEPVPVIVELARTMGLSQGMAARFFTVLSELFVNALEHGVLDLESDIKALPDGFERYESERGRRLQALERGHIQVDLWHSAHEDGRSMVITVTDSGRGFDHRAELAAMASLGPDVGMRRPAGRGLPLLHSLCDRIEFNQAGNSVTTELRYR